MAGSGIGVVEKKLLLPRWIVYTRPLLMSSATPVTCPNWELGPALATSAARDLAMVFAYLTCLARRPGLERSRVFGTARGGKCHRVCVAVERERTGRHQVLVAHLVSPLVGTEVSGLVLAGGVVPAMACGSARAKGVGHAGTHRQCSCSVSCVAISSLPTPPRPLSRYIIRKICGSCAEMRPTGASDAPFVP